jgi:hypothetical protein
MYLQNLRPEEHTLLKALIQESIVMLHDLQPLCVLNKSRNQEPSAPYVDKKKDQTYWKKQQQTPQTTPVEA